MCWVVDVDCLDLAVMWGLVGVLCCLAVVGASGGELFGIGVIGG